MKAKKRYFYLFFCILVFLSVWLFCSNRPSLSHDVELRNFQINPINDQNPRWQKENFVFPSNISECTFKTCFNMSRCLKSFKFFAYPLYDEQHHLKKYFKTDKWQLSMLYEKILGILKESQYYTSDIDEACFFVLSFDTLDRDTLSENFMPNLDKAIANLPENLWNNGINHLIFNLYAGTWPDYNTRDFGASFGYAMMAKASSASSDFRFLFDISLPLFSSNLPETFDDLYAKETYLQQCKTSSFVLKDGSQQHYLLTFKGKRYVHGIGSESRNVIYHLHNNRDVIILTTCKHGKNWEKMKDERCDIDNANYEKFDYDELMKNSTFCLIPRGRRLGSYRFLEALKFGCIPVILANGFIPPFSEVLDWDLAAVTADERHIFQLAENLRSFPMEKIKRMRQHVRLFYRSYFSSIESVILTTLELIKYRINDSTNFPKSVWNERYGGIWSYLPHIPDDPMLIDKPMLTKDSFTIIVNLLKPFHGYLIRMKNLLSDLSRLESIKKVYVLVHFSKVNEILPKHNATKIEIFTKNMKSWGIFYGFTLKIDSPCIVVLDASSYFKARDVNMAIEHFSARQNSKIVGYCALDEIWDEIDQVFKIVDAYNDSCYSLVSDSMMVTYRYFFDWLNVHSRTLSSSKDDYSLCIDLILNSFINRFEDDDGHLSANVERISGAPDAICTPRKSGRITEHQVADNSRKLLFNDSRRGSIPEVSYREVGDQDIILPYKNVAHFCYAS